MGAEDAVGVALDGAVGGIEEGAADVEDDGGSEAAGYGVERVGGAPREGVTAEATGAAGIGAYLTLAMIDPSRPVAELVLEHPECALVLTRLRIDFCCRGELSLAEACAGRGLEVGAVCVELAGALAAGHGLLKERDPRAMSTAALIGHIIVVHHEYLRRELPSLVALSAKVARVHGGRDARLVKVAELVATLAEKFVPHLDEEEQVVFPLMMLRTRDEAWLARELDAMVEDHREVGALVASIRDAAGDFKIAEWGCASYRTLVTGLARMELDVLAHVHLENHVLLPRFAKQAAGSST